MRTNTLGPCSCKRGQQRDNCPACEGTGYAIDFAAIRAQRVACSFKGTDARCQEPACATIEIAPNGQRQSHPVCAEHLRAVDGGAS